MAPITRSKAIQLPPNTFALSNLNLFQPSDEIQHSTGYKATDGAPHLHETPDGSMLDFPHIYRTNSQASGNSSSNSHSSDDTPTLYIIDLSLPPSQRYVKLATDLKLVIEDLVGLFDDLLDQVELPKKTFHFFAKCILRKLYSKEQTEELRGIHNVTRVPMYLLVAYNVLLDLFMGCTSGGVVVKERDGQGRMCHFRTLDWGMPTLRRALVQLEFRNGSNGEAIARSINYAGFVGTLTGVRKGLSVSFNSRPYHNDDGSKRANAKFYSHLLFVLLGWRPSICTHLRDLIIPKDEELKKKAVQVKKKKGARIGENRQDYKYSYNSLANIAKDFPSTPTTAGYLTFCDGTQTLILEKDRVTAKPLLSSSFLTVTNHDTSYDAPSSISSDTPASTEHVARAKTHKLNPGMDILVEESMDRKGCMTQAWATRLKALKLKKKDGERGYVGLEQLKEWMLKYPVTNEQTHFVALMDPTEGVFRWVRMWEEGQIGSEDQNGSEGWGEGWIDESGDEGEGSGRSV
jgi:hypothetical protein